MHPPQKWDPFGFDQKPAGLKQTPMDVRAAIAQVCFVWASAASVDPGASVAEPKEEKQRRKASGMERGKRDFV